MKIDQDRMKETIEKVMTLIADDCWHDIKEGEMDDHYYYTYMVSMSASVSASILLTILEQVDNEKTEIENVYADFMKKMLNAFTKVTNDLGMNHD